MHPFSCTRTHKIYIYIYIYMQMTEDRKHFFKQLQFQNKKIKYIWNKASKSANVSNLNKYRL